MSWNKAVAYIKLKDARLKYNLEFKPLFAKFKKELREEGTHESVVYKRAKKIVKELLKSKKAIAAITAEQGGAGQEEVQP